MLVERDGRNVALRTEDGALALPPATRASYSVDNWLLAEGDERDAEAACRDGPFRCDLLGCIGKVKGKTIALIRHPAALEEDCRIADIVIAPFSVGKGCEGGAGGGRPARAASRRRICALHRGAVDQERKRRRDARAKALGAGAPVAKPVLPSGQAYARDQGAADEAPDPRFDGNPEE